MLLPDGREALVSQHAIDRFKERVLMNRDASDAEAMLKMQARLLEASLGSLPESERIHRMLTNKFKKTEYWLHGKFRFILESRPNFPNLFLRTVENKSESERRLRRSTFVSVKERRRIRLHCRKLYDAI
ncbi:MAG: hypothetical protein AAB458_01290 [Patescibacteria group bacterium]